MCMTKKIKDGVWGYKNVSNMEILTFKMLNR